MMHQRAVKSAAFSPDGKWILTVSWDSAVHLWEAGTGKSIGRPLKHQRLIDDAEFTPKGDQILTLEDYGKATLWDVRADLDLPANLFKLQAQVITGCELQNNELQVISITLWYKLKDDYNEKAKEHYKVCKYREYNFWSRFYPEQAKKILTLK
jgi:WD40 repeat protein